jgi:dihydroorotate dehydrogenase (fumarate)
MCQDVGNVRRMEDAGASAVVLQSLFEEQIDIDENELDRFLTESAGLSAEATTHFPDLMRPVMGPDTYLATSSSASKLSVSRSSPVSTAPRSADG